MKEDNHECHCKSHSKHEHNRHSHEHSEQKHECHCHEHHKHEEIHSCCCGGHLHESSAHTKCSCGSCSSKTSSQGLALSLSGIAIATSFALTLLHKNLPFYPLTDPAWIAIFFCAFPIFKSAWISLTKEKRLTSALLVSIAILGAFALEIVTFFSTNHNDAHSHSYIFAAAEIAFLMRLGAWLEERTVRKSKAGIEALANMIPTRAIVKSESGEIEISAKDVKVGDIICVRPDSVFPCDAQVIFGNSTADESPISGESTPIEKSVGDIIYAGTSNISGYLQARVLKTSKDSEMSKVAKLVEEASGKKAPISRTADKWASVVIPAAIICALMVFLITRFAFGVTTLDASIRAVTVLVVFCPCAFVLATPTAIAAALGNAAKRGILFKSGEYLEKLFTTTLMFFDKTGTLTLAKIRVENFIALENFDEEKIIKLSGSAEMRSEHPIAKAIYAYAKERFNEIPEPDSIKSSAGIGVEAICGKDAISIEKSAFESDTSKALREKGYTVVDVKINGTLAAHFALSDTIRDSAPYAIAELKKQNMQCAIISGDNRASAEKIARQCVIDTVFAPLMPKDKLRKISEAQEKGESVCMVGDGVNDAPALVRADSSIAIASLKNGIAIDAAQISILGEDLCAIPYSIKLSKHTIKTIKVNIAFSVIFNFAVLGLALFGIINPVAGALIHNMSSICVVLNSARILRFK